MIRRLMVPPLLAALVVASQGVAVAQYPDSGYGHNEVRYERSTLQEIRSALRGPAEPAGSPFLRYGHLGDGRPFRARFTDVQLRRFEAPQLVAIVEDAASLPPDSRVEIEGRMGWQPFRVVIRNDWDGRKSARLEGLASRGVQHARLDARIGYRHVIGRIDNGMTRIEG